MGEEGEARKVAVVKMEGSDRGKIVSGPQGPRASSALTGEDNGRGGQRQDWPGAFCFSQVQGQKNRCITDRCTAFRRARPRTSRSYEDEVCVEQERMSEREGAVDIQQTMSQGH